MFFWSTNEPKFANNLYVIQLWRYLEGPTRASSSTFQLDELSNSHFLVTDASVSAAKANGKQRYRGASLSMELLAVSFIECL